jgi:hypothetical protein
MYPPLGHFIRDVLAKLAQESFRGWKWLADVMPEPDHEGNSVVPCVQTPRKVTAGGANGKPLEHRCLS